MRAADFVVETTTSIAGTSGDGAVTLTALTATPRFSTALGSSKRWVKYSITQTSTGKCERGMGYVSANVLTRSKPQVSFDGTTWDDDSSVTLVQFGASPTSGDTLIRLAPLADSLGAGIIDARLNNTTIGDATWNDYWVSDHISTSSNPAAGSAQTADQQCFDYYHTASGGVVVGAQMNVTTAAGTGVKLALYDIGPDGYPATKILDFNTLSTASTGVKNGTATSTVRITPGWYAIGRVGDGATVFSRTAQVPGKVGPLGRKDGYGHSFTLTVTGGSYSSGNPSDATISGPAMIAGSSGLANNWIGLKITP